MQCFMIFTGPCLHRFTEENDVCDNVKLFWHFYRDCVLEVLNYLKQYCYI